MRIFLVLAVFFVALSSANAQSAKRLLEQAMEYYNTGNCTDATPLFDDLLSVNSFGNNKKLEYSVNYYGGYCSRSTGHYENAAKYMKRALVLANELVIEDQYPVINMFLGEIAREQGDYKASEAYYNTVMDYIKKGSEDAATVMYYLAETHRAAKNYGKSVAACDEAIIIAKERNLIALEIACLTSTGEVYNESGDYSAAIKTFTQALTMSQNAQLPLEIANINTGLGLVYQALEKNDLARQHYEEAVRFYVMCLNVTNIPMLVDRLISLPPCTQAQAERTVDTYESYAETFFSLDDEATGSQIQLLADHYRQIANENTAGSI